MKWRWFGGATCLSLALLFLFAGCRRGESYTEATGSGAALDSAGSKTARAAALPPPPFQTGDDEELPSKIAEVSWKVEPPGATVSIESPQGIITAFSVQDQPVFVPLRADFYEVNITHPDCESWSKRLGLGGAATNQMVKLSRHPVTAVAAETIIPEATVAQAEVLSEEAVQTPDAQDEIGVVPEAEVAAVVAAIEAPESPATETAAEAETVEAIAEPAPVVTELAEVVEATVAGDTAAEETLVEEKEPELPQVAVTEEPVEQVPELPQEEARFVRLALKSTAVGDYALPHVIKHLHLADGSILPLENLERPFERAALGAGPVTLRVDLYDVEPPFQELEAVVPAGDGIAELRFAVHPQPARVRFVEIPAMAEIWNRTAGLPGERLGFAGQEIRLPPFVPHRLEVRLPGFQPSSLELRVAHPTEDLGEIEPVLLPPPRFARPGQRCSVVLPQGVDMNFVWVPGGRFVMTDPRFVGEFPDVRVETVPQGFWMAEREVSHAEWAAVLGQAIPADEDATLPRTGMTWEEANEFARRLGNLISDARMRLPTEGEWEFAALAAGQVAAIGNGAGDIHCLPESASRIRAAGAGTPNVLGLLNMLGNVREWCAATYAPYRGGTPADPTLRVVRGGGFRSAIEDCHPQVRDALPTDFRSDDVGFRVIFQIQPQMRVKR